MSRRTEAGAVDVLEVFGRAGAFHVVVNVASLVRWALSTLLKQARLCNERSRVTLSTVSRQAIGTRGVVLASFADALSMVVYEGSCAVTTCTVVVRELVRRARFA